MMVGPVGFALPMWTITPLTHDWGWREPPPQDLRSLSQHFAAAPTVTLAPGGLEPARLKPASGLFNLMRNPGDAIGIAVCGTILNDHTSLHSFGWPSTSSPATDAQGGPCTGAVG